MQKVTCIAPVNIAVIKYWGKSDEDLVLPLNDSLSGTLSTDFMCAKTTISTSPALEVNKFWLNGIEQSFENERLLNCLKEVKRRANQTLPHLNWNISICSENNFPTAAGLASSAAGYACLVSALAALYEIEGDISAIARRGSGSACRSVYGGWVQWCKGASPTGEDSIAKQIAPASHWPQMRVLILVVNDERKKYSSTSGMKRSVETSELLQYRATKIVPQRIEAITKAIINKDFQAFAQITMEDSNQFHAVCLDTFPPCVYMNDTSHAIVDVVHAYNDFKKSNKVAYTFDAGPNACLYLLDSEVEEVLSVIDYVFPPVVNSEGYLKGIPLSKKAITEELKAVFEAKRQNFGALKYVIHTRIGDGPKTLTNPEDHLVDEMGLPKKMC
uniref:Diphosphomevalonate decarboxylase n=1 Tax=Colaphellus bowringi TaxID=561076 RepID=A0A8G0QEH3_9CUCU|nr:diphosphomevalonate decarboxylase [Colaphellus bowringi]